MPRLRLVTEFLPVPQLTADDRELGALKVYADGPCEDTIVRYTPAA